MWEMKPKSVRVLIAIVAAIALIAILFAGWSAARAQSSGTEVRGDISVDTTWTADKSPYKVIGFLQVIPGATLTIEPGVVVEASELVPITIRGALVAEGSAEQPILFTAATKARGGWLGLYASGSVDAPSTLSLRHVIVEYGSLVDKFDGGNLTVVGSANVTIRDSIFRQGGAHGINAALSASLQISDSAFLDNQLAAVRLTGVMERDPLLHNLRAEGNRENVIQFNTAGIETGVHTLVQPGPALPYRFQGGFMVRKDGHLIIQPGVEMQVESSYSVYGALTAKGTAEQPIRFTRKDAESPNWWGLYIAGGYESTATAQLDHVIIEYGGQPTGHYDGNLIVDSSVVSVTNSLLRAGGESGISNKGGLPGESHSLYVADSHFVDNQGSAIRCTGVSCRQTFSNLSASGNGFDGIAQKGVIIGDTVWPDVGLPYLIDEQSGIRDGTLTIEPGSEVRFSKDAVFAAYGNLFAIGTPEEPIIFTGSEAQRGWWQGIYAAGRGAIFELRYCEVSYGGGTVDSRPSALLVMEMPAAITVSDCHLHHSAGPAVRVGSEHSPTLRRNRIEENAFGVQRSRTSISPFGVDARYNWWGAASGPTHATNPDGSGAEVSDYVLFDPWLDSPDQDVASGLEVIIGGVGHYGSGRTVPYSIRYNNLSGETLKDAVLRVALPANSNYLDSTGGGIFWPEYRQVFWKLGDLPSGSGGHVVVRVQYEWGLANGLDAMIAAQLSGSNITPQPFDLASYLNYQPRIVTGEVELSKEEVDAERTANPDFDALYNAAVSAGYSYGSALEQSYNTGDVVKQTILLKFQPQMSAYLLWSQGETATGIAIDGSSFTVYRSGGTLRYDLQTDQWQDGGAGEAIAAATTWNGCMANCIEEKLPGFIVKKYIKIVGTLSKVISCIAAARTAEGQDIASCSKLLGKAIPGYGESVDLGLCNSDCQTCEANGQGCNDDSCHCCSENRLRCSDDDWIYSKLGGRDVIKIRRCNRETHKYFAEEVHRVCASCEKCIVAAAGPVCTQQQSAAAASQLQPATAELSLLSASTTVRCDECSTARDPNEMHGPEGDLLPGQLLTYTIDYENIGAGEAYGVFVVNEVSEHFDLSTLQLPEEAILAAASRTIYFPVGELAPKGQPGAQGKIIYSVRLKSGLPSGTVISNQAVVHFPSVPEETPTNVVINTIQPIVVTPLALETAFEQPLAIQLHGQDVSNQPLSFAVAQGVFYGTLSGTPPNLSYQPAPGFTGLDRFTFTASNGVESSRPAEVTILVGANSSDQQPPVIVWTAPQDGAVVGASLVLASGNGETIYTPRIQLQFSEAMDASTVTSATIQVKGAGDHLLPVDVIYDAASDQAVVFLKEAAKADTLYTVTVAGTAADLAGNRMGQEFTWSFRSGERAAQPKMLFLPEIVH
jgi:hypothetical protein